MINIEIQTFDGANGKVHIDAYPDRCPFCHHGVDARIRTVLFINGRGGELVLQCTFRNCQRLFIAYYQRPAAASANHYFLNGTSFGTEEPATTFSDNITTLSPSFVTIFQQAEIAERGGLLEICGVGYRKAIEFLIKDYAIHEYPDQKAVIEKTVLAQCISEFVTDTKVKSVASRAVWLGNDETHYVRRWEGKDLKDLKILINLTVHWLEMEAETKRFEEEMPARQGKP